MSQIYAWTTLIAHHQNQFKNLAVAKISKLNDNQNNKYHKILIRILINKIFFLPYLSDNFQKIIHQKNIHKAVNQITNQTKVELTQNHFTIKGMDGNIKLNHKTSKKMIIKGI